MNRYSIWYSKVAIRKCFTIALYTVLFSWRSRNKPKKRCWRISLKGTVSPPIDQTYGLTPFRLWLRIRREIRDDRSKSSASTVSMRPRKPQWSRGSGFRCYGFGGFNETAESLNKLQQHNFSSKGSFQLNYVLNVWLPRSQCDRWSGFSSLNAAMKPRKRIPRLRLWRFQWDRGILKKNLNNIIFPQKGSFQLKTMS
jgi:hypothetical protein